MKVLRTVWEVAKGIPYVLAWYCAACVVAAVAQLFWGTLIQGVASAISFH